jgi:hypothetical protein
MRAFSSSIQFGMRTSSIGRVGTRLLRDLVARVSVREGARINLEPLGVVGMVGDKPAVGREAGAFLS